MGTENGYVRNMHSSNLLDASCHIVMFSNKEEIKL